MAEIACSQHNAHTVYLKNQLNIKIYWTCHRALWVMPEPDNVAYNFAKGFATTSRSRGSL